VAGVEGGDMKKKQVETINELLRDALLAYAGLDPESPTRAAVAQRLFGPLAVRSLLPQLDEIARSVRPTEAATA
jgi:hypothetical protein